MKKGYTMLELLTVIAIIGIVVAMSIPIFGGFKQWKAKQFGGSMNVELRSGEKLVNCTWKEPANLWILTKARNSDEKPETYYFREKSKMGILQGEVIIQEK